MEKSSNPFQSWLGRILFAIWIGLSFIAKQLFGGFVADVISGRLSIITGMHESDVVREIYTYAIIFTCVGVLILIAYAFYRFANAPSSRHSYITAADAVKYIADESEWGRRKRAQPPNERGLYELPRFAAVEEFVRAAREGNIAVLGCADRTGEHQRIAQAYWLYHTVDLDKVIHGDQAGSTISTSRAHLETSNRYDMLTVDQSEVFRVWPRPQQRSWNRFWFKQSSA